MSLVTVYAPDVQVTVFDNPSIVAQDITREATATNSETNHPLPLAGQWWASDWNHFAAVDGGFSASWQQAQVQSGHHLLCHMYLHHPTEIAAFGLTTSITAMLNDAIPRFAALGVPFTLKSMQWEYYLSQAPYLTAPYAANPNVWTNGAPVAKVSAFGPLQPWYNVGYSWTNSWLMALIASLYPAPPCVVFLSNNEAVKQTWMEVDSDQHYLDQFSAGASAELKRQRLSAAYIVRYRELQRGMRDGLPAAWRSVAKFVGYEAFGKEFFGRWGGWPDYALPIANRIDPWCLAWDGGSPSYYLATYKSDTDFTLYSPQLEAMNWVFMQDEAHALNPAFWFEMSTWTGLGASMLTTWPAWYPSFTPARYGAMVQFGMWLLRPRVVRDLPYTESWGPRSIDEPWFSKVIAAVDRVWADTTLTRFWRQGQLVANASRPHPYQVVIPAEYASVPRMFMLTTNLDPAQPWTSVGAPILDLNIPVFAVARVIGTTPTREWIVYAHSPLADRTGVVITIPGYHAITVTVPIAGAFYWVKEANTSVTQVGL